MTDSTNPQADLATAGQILEPTADVAIGTPTAAPAPAKRATTTKVRLLVDGEHGRANDVVELPSGLAKELAKAGAADDHKDAVAYAMTLEQNQRHKA